MDVELVSHPKGRAYTLRVFGNRLRGRIFGPKTEEVTGGWRKLNNKEPHTLHSSLSAITQI
jgi:hypothetical protein